MLGQRNILYQVIRRVVEDAQAKDWNFQIYSSERMDQITDFHVSFRFLQIANRERLLQEIRKMGYECYVDSKYEESATWMKASSIASKWVLNDLADRFPDLTSPDRDFIMYLFHCIMDDLFMGYEDEYDVYGRLFRWAGKKVEMLQK